MVSTCGKKSGKNCRNLRAIRSEKRRRCEKYLRELLAKKAKREYILYSKVPNEYEYEYEPDLPCSAWQDYLNCFYEESDHGVRSRDWNQYESLLATKQVKEEKEDICDDIKVEIPDDITVKEESDLDLSDNELNNLFTTTKDEVEIKEEEEENDPIMEADTAFNFKHAKRKKFEYRSYLSPFEVKIVLDDTKAPKNPGQTNLRSSNRIGDLETESRNSYYQKHRRKKNLGPRPFHCAMCGARFMTKGNLKAHSETVHSNERNFECTDCGLKFKTKYHLKTHCQNIHNKYKSDSAVKNDASKDQNRYPRRERLKISDKLNCTCSVCGVALNNRRLLNMHMLVAHTKKYTKNSKAKSLKPKPKRMAGRRAYNLREISESDKPLKRIVRPPPSSSEEIRIFECNDCYAFYSSKCLLKNHILETHLFYHCEYPNCGLVFKKKKSLQRHHYRVHSEAIPLEKKPKKHSLTTPKKRGRPPKSVARFECDICKDKFPHKSFLMQHIIQKHAVKDRKAHASHNSGILPNMKKRHSGRPLDPSILQRKHKCGECTMAFKTRCHLKAHQKQRHSDERNFVCTVCNAQFKMKGILKTHMLRMHKTFKQ